MKRDSAVAQGKFGHPRGVVVYEEMETKEESTSSSCLEEMWASPKVTLFLPVAARVFAIGRRTALFGSIGSVRVEGEREGGSCFS